MKTLRGTAVLAGAVMVSIGCLTGCNIEVDAGKKKTETRSYDVTEKVTSIKVTSDVGRVEVIGSDSPGIKVQEKLSWTSEHRKPKPKHDVNDGTLTFTSKCEGNVIGFSSCGVSYRVQVPRAIALELHNDDGSLDVSGLNGALRLATDTGAITATGLNTPFLSASTGDGSIKLSGRATATELRTATGSINSSGLHTDKLTARTGDGSIKVRLTAPPSTVNASTDTGSVDLSVPTSQPYDIDLRADTGSLDIDPGVRRDTGAPHKIKVRTGDGSVHVRAA